MRAAFVFIVFVHGLIHLMGFLKAFRLADIRELTLHISGFAGMLWLCAACLFVMYGILMVTGVKYAWVVGLAAVVVSQILAIWFWKDARFATIPNLLILTVAISAWGGQAFEKLTRRETQAAAAAVNRAGLSIFEEKVAAGLPEPVGRWLLASGAVGREHVVSGLVTQKARMKMKPGQEKWLHATASQITTVDPPAFVWTVNLQMNPLMHMAGRDKFVDGKGAMRILMNGLINVVNEAGEKLDEGTIQRYLGELVWFPTLAVSPLVTWEALDEHSARATMTYMGTTGSGTFWFDAQGNFVRFSAWRYMGNEPESERREWVLTVDDYREFDGIRVPSKMKATWRLEEGDWTWLDLEITDIQYNT